MAKDNPEIMVDSSEDADAVHELRRAVLDLGKALKSFGKLRLAEFGEDVSEEAHIVAHEARGVILKLEHRLEHLEDRVDKSVRGHPGAWASGLLGVIGFGIAIGLFMRRH